MLSFSLNVVKEGKYKRRDCYFLVDSDKGEWVFEQVGKHLDPEMYLAFLKVPSKYESIRGTLKGIPFFKEVEKEAKRAIKNYHISKDLTPKTAQTFKELIDEL